MTFATRHFASSFLAVAAMSSIVIAETRAAPKSAKSSVATTLTSPIVDEVRLWKQTPLLVQVAKKLNPLGTPAGDGALGANRKFPDRVSVSQQLEGWNWIRAGATLGNGFVVDRGIMAFEWAFARMLDDGSFGESNTVEVAHFLGLYARSVLLLRSAKMDERAKRLERLLPRLESSLRSSKSLLGERRWDGAERKTWVTQQRIQAAAAAYWIGRLMVNPNLKKTADLWLDEALRRQEATGLFPNSFPPTSKAAARAQVESLEALQGLAWADPIYAVKLKAPLTSGFKWLETTAGAKKSTTRGAIEGTGPAVTLATYGAWTKNAFATRIAKDFATSNRPAKRTTR